MKYHVTTKHSASSHGIPVMVDSKGKAYGVADPLPVEKDDPLSWLKEEAGELAATKDAHPETNTDIYPDQITEDSPGLLKAYARQWYSLKYAQAALAARNSVAK